MFAAVLGQAVKQAKVVAQRERNITRRQVLQQHAAMLKELEDEDDSDGDMRAEMKTVTDQIAQLSEKYEKPCGCETKSAEELLRGSDWEDDDGAGDKEANSGWGL